MFRSDTLSVIGHRVASLFDRQRFFMLRKFHHPAKPDSANAKGAQGFDNLHQVAPMLASLLETCQGTLNPESGKAHSLDEETLKFQGPSADLKQTCGKFKAAGDGLQLEAVCKEGGVLVSFCVRGHSLLPKVI